MLKIHHIRNATLVLETQKDRILVDPMLGPKGFMPSFTIFRHRVKKNPTVALPSNSDAILRGITHCIITHLHPDHLDTSAVAFLRDNRIPVTCSIKDKRTLERRGLHVVKALKYWEKKAFLGGTIEGIPAKHGYGMISKIMGNVIGYYIQLPSEKSIYLSSDTIYTASVAKVLHEYQPEISVLACGTPQFDVFQKLTMHTDDLITFIKKAPGVVIANHMESLNHCPLSREKLREVLVKKGLSSKVLIPADGDQIEMH